jgi:hypothetical protein
MGEGSTGVAGPEPAPENDRADEGAPPRRTGRPSALTAPVAPFISAGGYYARAWRRYLSRRSPGDIPVVRPTLALAGGALLDEIILTAFTSIQPGRGSDPARVEREAIEATALYEEHGWCDHPEGFFSAPPPLDALDTRTIRSRRFTYERAGFESGYEPHPGEPGRDRWLGHPSNGRVRAWMLRHDEPRPWLIVVHGARMGRPTMDLTLLRAHWLHHDLGLNVVVPVLPLHGPRRKDLERGSEFPGEDLLDNVHGTAQSVWDVRRLISWIRLQDPAAAIGITGISLGGYVTSLTASVEEGLACAIVGVPAVDLVDLIQHHARLPPGHGRSQVAARTRRVARVISPLVLSPRVPFEGRFVYAGLADRLVHPRRQVVRLWDHWGRPEIHWFEGGHTGMFRSKSVELFLREALTSSGMVAGRDGQPAG